MFGAAAMSLSSFFVVTNALRLRFFRPDFAGKTENTKTEGIHDKEEHQMKKTVSINGMMCAHCVAHVKEALEKTEGVASADVSLEKKNAVVSLSGNVSDEKLEKAVADAGYEAVSVSSAGE
jgi:Cu+-exporting ATPase